jgi:hypothetical protein
MKYYSKKKKHYSDKEMKEMGKILRKMIGNAVEEYHMKYDLHDLDWLRYKKKD